MRKTNQKTTEQYRQEMLDKKGHEFEVIGEYVGAREKIEIKHNSSNCNYSTFKVHAGSFLTTKGCPNCNNGRKHTKDKFAQDIYELVGDEYIFLEKYINNLTKIKIRHNSEKCENYEYYVRPKDFKKGQRCEKCRKIDSNYNAMSNDDFLQKLNNIHKNEIISLEKYINSNTRITFQHNSSTCNHIFKAKPTHILRGQGCPNCKFKKIGDKKRIPVERVYEWIQKANYEFIEFPNEYKSHKSLVTVSCLEGHISTKTVQSVKYGHSCPTCNDSRGERRILEYLNSIDLNYYPQHRFDDCRYKNPLPFDFYIPTQNILIEYQGQQHYESVEAFGGEEALKETIRNDKIKKDYCLNNNIKLLEIPYWDFDRIEEILKNTLNK